MEHEMLPEMPFHK